MSSVQTQRLTGMFSGMDTDALVKAMVSNQQSKIDQLDRKKQLAEWKKDAYTDFNTKLKAFRENFGSALGAESLVKKSAFVDYTVTMATNNSLKVTGTANAKGGNYNVRIDQIATATTLQSAKLTANASGLSETVVNKTAIGDIQSFAAGAFATIDGNINFSINGVDFSFNTSDSLKTVMDTVNKSSAGVTMSYSQISDSISIASNQMGEFKGIAYPGDIAPTDPDALTEYNKQLSAYKEDQKKNITFDDKTGFLSHLGMSGVQYGQNAIVYINGESEARSLTSNTLTLDGVTMSFLRATDSAGIDFDLTPNRQTAVDNVKKFIETFNGLVADLFNAYSQKSDRDYNPLVQSQKDEMETNEIDLWQSKAKEGILYRDDELGRLLSNLRGILTKAFGDNNSTLASIGITTGKYSAGSPFTLELDETKLMTALEEDSENVFSIFSQATTGGAEGGFIMQVSKHIDNFSSNTKAYNIQNLTKNIADYATRIKEQTTKLDTLSEKYYLQYSKMETALSEMQAQQDSMSSLFSS